MFLIEGTTHSRPAWLTALTCDAGEFDELIERGLFERTRSGLWRFHFVGTLVLRDRFWLCIPRVLKDRFSTSQIELANFERLSLALEVYGSRSKARRAGQDEIATQLTASDRATSPIRELEILASLVEWTSSYGFHHAEEERFSWNFNKRTDWSKTVNSSITIHTKKGLLYDDPQSIDVIRRHTAIAAMQSRTLLNLLDKYKALAHGLFESTYELSQEAKNLLEHWHDRDALSQQELQDALDATNRDHEKDLISLLIAVTKIWEERRIRNGSVTLYGTTAFEQIWEDMCRMVFCEEPPLDGHLSNPAYTLENENELQKVSPQRPDVMSEYQKTIVILDAKYYPDFPASRPDLEDVRKQFFYAISLPEGSSSISGFLFPRVIASDFEYLGKVTMVEDKKGSGDSVSADPRFPLVHCIGLQWDRMIDIYLGRFPAASLRDKIFPELSARQVASNSPSIDTIGSA